VSAPSADAVVAQIYIKLLLTAAYAVLYLLLFESIMKLLHVLPIGICKSRVKPPIGVIEVERRVRELHVYGLT